MTVLADGTIVKFGGVSGGDYVDSNAVHKLTVSSTTATWTRLSGSGNAPSWRHAHTMVALDDGTGVMFGGRDWWNWFIHEDIFKLAVSGTTAAWTQLSSSGAFPGGRYSHSMTVLAEGTVVMFGGNDNTYQPVNDVHQLTVSGTTAFWTELIQVWATLQSRGMVMPWRYWPMTLMCCTAVEDLPAFS